MKRIPRYTPPLAMRSDRGMPVYKKLRKMRRAAGMHQDNFADLDSTKYAEAMNNAKKKWNYQIDPVYKKKGVHMAGQLQFMKGAYDNPMSYHSPEYADMILAVRDLREEYLRARTTEDRKSIA